MSYLFKELLVFNRPKMNQFRIIGAGICMLIVLFIGYFSGNMQFASFGSLGIFTFLYYQHLPAKQLLQRMLTIGAYFYLCMIVGMLTSHIPWLVPLIVGLVAFIGRVGFRLYHIAKPGSFFSIMIVTMGSSTRIPLDKLLLTSSYFLIGVAVSLIMGFVILMTERTPTVPLPTLSLINRLQSDPGAILDGIFYATTLFFIAYLSYGLAFHNSYWMVVSCASILMGDNLRAIFHRNIQRIFGTTIGLGIAAFIFSMPLSLPMTLCLIAILFTIVEFFIPRNYGLANFFTTPLALLLSTLVQQQYHYSLLSDRLLGIAIGSVVGLLSAWIFTTGLKFYHRAILPEQINNPFENTKS